MMIVYHMLSYDDHDDELSYDDHDDELCMCQYVSDTYKQSIVYHMLSYDDHDDELCMCQCAYTTKPRDPYSAKMAFCQCAYTTKPRDPYSADSMMIFYHMLSSAS